MPPFTLTEREVPESPDLERIRCLPWMPWEQDPQLPQLIEVLTVGYKTPRGTMTLWPDQAASLKALHDYGGLFAPVPVGGGKTIISLLGAAAVKAERPLLLIPKGHMKKTRAAAFAYAEHWRIPPIKIMGYEKLSRDYDGAELRTYDPDLIIGDEADALANTKSSRWQTLRDFVYTKRRAGGVVRVAFLSGSFVTSSIREYWHLIRMALGDYLCPLPVQVDETMKWGLALNYHKDESQLRLGPGALLSLGPYDPEAEPLVQGRQAYQARLHATPGVVAVKDSIPKREMADGKAESVPLRIRAIELKAPPAIRNAVERLRDLRETPDGHPFDDDISIWRHARELQCGLYYVWNPRPPAEWMLARREWSQWCYATLKHTRTYRSKGHLIKAIARGEVDDGGLYARWRGIKDTFKINVEPRWIDTTTLERSAEWLRANPRGICWVEHTCFGDALSTYTGLPFFREQACDARGRMIEQAEGPIIASVQSCAKGFNLQYKWNRALYVSPFAASKRWQQSLGRIHRNGQTEDCEVDVFMMVLEAYTSLIYALGRAEYTQQTLGEPQKLLYAERDLGQVERCVSAGSDRMWIDDLEAI